VPNSTTDSSKYKKCSQGDNCIHPDGPVLPRTEEYFYMSKGHASARCRPCMLAYRRAHHERNREHDNQRSLEYVRRNKEKVYADNRRWLENNWHRAMEYGKWRYKSNVSGDRDRRLKYYRDNQERLKQNSKRWDRENRERRRVIANRRRARLKKAVGSHTPDDIKKLLELSKGLCWWCGKPVGERYEVDHRVPLAKGGSNAPENLCISCPECNRSKNANMPWDFNGRLL
jgi:5-methylcytosine-specific restriction endonuclease McrA